MPKETEKPPVIFSEPETFIVPSEYQLENVQADIIIVGKKKKTAGHFFGSPVGLKTKKTKKNYIKKTDKKILFKSIFGLIAIVFIGLIAVQAYKTKSEIGKLTYDSKIHITNAMDSIDQGDMAGALKEANIANVDIKKLKLITQSWGQDAKFIQLISPDSKLVANEKMLDATFTIVNTLTDVNQKITGIGGNSSSTNLEGRGSDFIINISESRNVIIEMVNTGRLNLQKSKEDLISARNGVSKDNQDQIDNAISSIDKTTKSLDFIFALTNEDLPWLSGIDGVDKNILILFQNNAELRGASGGSLGSFGVAKFSGGKLKTIDFAKNIYKIDNAFEATGQHVNVPKELVWLRGENSWTLKDSGWSVDGEESSKNIMQFYQKETGEKVDGVVMIDTSAVISLLSAIGPINMPEYEVTVDANNFRQVVEYEVHKGYFTRPGSASENEPKKILSDLMPLFMNKVFASLGNKEESIKILSSFSKSLKQKNITFYFDNQDFQNRINKLNYSGSVTPTTNDYIYVNNSNIDGAKSSLSIMQNINLTVNIDSNGKIDNSLNLFRKHTGSATWPDGINKNFVRLLLPENSVVKKFDPQSGNYQEFYNYGNPTGEYYVSNEVNKSLVNFWMSTDPGKNSELKIDYSPNYNIQINNEFTYALDLQKQPGALDDNVDLTIKYPNGFVPTNVKNFDSKSNSLNIKFVLDKDRTVKIKFKKI